MPGVLAIEPFASLENALALVRWHAGAIILDAQLQMPGLVVAEADAHPPQAQPPGVFQQVAKQFEQGALLHRHPGIAGHGVFNLYVLFPVDLGQGPTQAFQQRLQTHLVPNQAALAQAGALQLVVDLLAHALDLAAQHPRLLAVFGTLPQVLAHPLQDRQRGFQAVGQVAERIAVAPALLALAVQQAVEGTGQAQQLAGVFATQSLAGAGFDFVQLNGHAAQRAQAPGQPGPEQQQQDQQGRAEAEIEFLAQATEGLFIFAKGLQGNDAVGRAATAEQLDLDVVDEELLAIVLADPREFVATAVVAWLVVDVLVGGGPRAPDQVALAVVDVAEQTTVGQVETLVRQQYRHHQPVVFDPGSGDQRGHVRCQALLDGFLQGQAEGFLQCRQQGQHEQQRQQRRRQHQAQAQRTDHRQRSVNR